MADSSSMKKRQQLSKIVDLDISHSRVRKYLSIHGINRESKEKVQEFKDQVEEIKKKGAPPLGNKPEKPIKPKKDEYKDNDSGYGNAIKKYDADIVAYTAEKKQYDTAADAYNKYVSDEYSHLKVVHAVHKSLTKISELLNRRANDKKFPKSANTELAKTQASFGTVPNKYGNESDDTFKKRSDIYKEINTFLGKVDTNNVNAVTAAADKLAKRYPSLSIFSHKDEWSHQSYRINDNANIALAVIMQAGIEELAEHTMKNAIKEKKAIIQPDHCVSEGVEKCSLYPLFNKLPHFVAIRDRQKRHIAWEEEKKASDEEAAKRAKAIAKRKGTKYTRPDSKFSKFEEYEHEHGHCEKVTTTTTDKNGKNVKKDRYEWYNIDIDERDTDADSDETEEDGDGADMDDNGKDKDNFTFYVRKLCLRIKANKVEENYQDHDDIRISGNIAKFFSNLVIDFISRIAPLIKSAVEYKKAATISEKTVKFVLKMILLDSRKDADSTDVLSEEHSGLMDLIDNKIRIANAHHTEAKPAAPAASDAKAKDLGDDSEEKIVEQPAKSSKPAAAPQRRARK
jgi:hypothetical protein